MLTRTVCAKVYGCIGSIGSSAWVGVELAQGEASLVLAGKRAGVLGAEGVARVVSDRLAAMRQPL